MKNSKLALISIVLSLFCANTTPQIVMANEETPKKEENLKSWLITYRIDEENKRGKPQETTILAKDSPSAKKLFRKNNPKAVIISVSEIQE